MTQDQRRAHSLPRDDPHYLNVEETERQAEEDQVYSWQDFAVTALTKQWSAAPSERATIVLDSSCSLSRGQSFIHAMFFCHYHDPISFENCVSQIAERAGAGTRAFKRNCPLEFNYACCWVLLQKVLCQEFLIMLCILPTGLHVWAIGFGLVECGAGQRIKTQTASLIWKQSTSRKKTRWRGVSCVMYRCFNLMRCQ